MTHRIDPDLQSAIAELARAIPRPRYSETVRQMLLDNGLVTEIELAELRGEPAHRVSALRSRGKMPPHYRWGALVLYRAGDIAEMITAEPVRNAAHRRRSDNAAA